MRALVDDVLRRLNLERPRCDLAGLTSVYAAWCQAVPFDNAQKLLHVTAGRAGPLPGSRPDDFFAAWLEAGTGGTCWAGNGALQALLVELGFAAERALGTMLVSPDTPPNHGSVAVRLPEGQFLVDASILSGAPLRLPAPDEPAPPASGPLPRVERIDGRWHVRWRTVRDPQGFLCRLERVGLDAAEWDQRHQRTAGWSPFNYALSVRLNRGPVAIGWGQGQRFCFDGAGALSAEPRDRAGRDRFLIDELGFPAALVARLPEDRETPPPPPA